MMMRITWQNTDVKDDPQLVASVPINLFSLLCLTMYLQLSKMISGSLVIYYHGGEKEFSQILSQSITRANYKYTCDK